jgi:signal transduction histidine kinase/CheY-like chemotaxis protein
MKSEETRILSVRIRTETDIVLARQRARQIAILLSFPLLDQVSLATAVSEIARNAFQHAGGGTVDFEISLHTRPQFFRIRIADQGPGIENVEALLNGQHASKYDLGIGLTGTRKLADRFEVSSSRAGTCVQFGKAIPVRAVPLDMAFVAQVSSQLAQQPVSGLSDELQQQNRELVRTLESLRTRQMELDRRKEDLERLNLELEETNRGVVALYAELEERAVALRRANELKSQFLSHVSHEFRTPLNSITALTHILLRRTDGPLEAEQEKQVAFIRQAAEGLVEMVNDLLDLAKVEAGKTEVRITRVEVGQVFGAVRALMRPLATNASVSLVFEEPVPRLVLDTDEAKLGQILRNLVSNALKFTERGEVRVSTRLSAAEDKILFTVADTGIGIAPEDMETVFQEFVQIHHSMQKRVKGTGLGLPLSRKLAGLLGGNLEVTSQPGVGSSFILTLPARTPAFSEAQPEAPTYGQAEEGVILIVDDEEASRYICRQMFRRTNYRIIDSSGMDAAERARFERPQLIILDLMMPGRTGFEVLDELKSDPTTQDIPVVIHTSKRITEADQHRLAGRHLALLPKAGTGRESAFRAIRTALQDPNLFMDEAEFAGRTDSSGVLR